MEHAKNGELFDLINTKGPCSEPIARHFFKPLLEAVKYCHEQGLAHRDIKLENVLLDENYVVKLSDFCFAGPVDEIMPKQFGTEGYVAPEIYEGRGRGDKADMFALGVCLFILVTKVPPFAIANPKTNMVYRTVK